MFEAKGRDDLRARERLRLVPLFPARLHPRRPLPSGPLPQRHPDARRHARSRPDDAREARGTRTHRETRGDVARSQAARGSSERGQATDRPSAALHPAVECGGKTAEEPAGRGGEVRRRHGPVRRHRPLHGNVWQRAGRGDGHRPSAQQALHTVRHAEYAERGL